MFTEEYLGADRQRILLEPDFVPRGQDVYLGALKARQTGTPIQYILGHWEFDGLDLAVGPGVLIPREDTIPLVEAAAGFIGARPLQGFDLCAGTGAVALAVANRCPNARIEALELFPEPLVCLNKNTARFGGGRVFVRKYDVLFGPGDFTGLDFILSNPPYIAEEEIPCLQAEVQMEPHTALDGGTDGLDFYRAIAGEWVKALNPGGLLAVEIGETQSGAVERLFHEAGLTEIRTLQDFNGLDRVVRGIK